METIVYLNGEYVPLKEARISAMDYGFLYGYGLFETMRAYNGIVFRLSAHLDRLAKSAGEIGFKVPFPTLESAVRETIAKNRLQDARVRCSVSIGEGSPIPGPYSCTQPTVFITATNYLPYPKENYEKGFRTIVSSIQRNSRSPLSRLKTANYLECLLARQEARAAGADEGIFLNESGLIAEGSMSNIFLITGGVLKTPNLKAGILPGITRGVILELALEMGIKIQETEIMPRELAAAEEAFLTNSLIEVMPLTGIEGRPVGDGKPGRITKWLREAYRREVEKEVREKTGT